MQENAKLPFIVNDTTTDATTFASIMDLVSTADLSASGYNLLSADHIDGLSTGMFQVNVSLQHISPNFGKYIAELLARGGKFTKIYSDTPQSKTKITRWLTGFREGQGITATQKAAAIKVAHLAGLDALQPLLTSIESRYNALCAANFTGAKTNKKGQSFFEIFIIPDVSDDGAPADPIPPQPNTVPLDSEPIEVIASPADPVKKRRKTTKAKKPKAKFRKLSVDNKEKGHRIIRKKGLKRHVVPLPELDNITDHVTKLILGSGTKKVAMSAADAHDKYSELNTRSRFPIEHNEKVFRIVDDYFDDPLPILKFYKGYIVTGKVKSKSLMTQYRSIGSNKHPLGGEDKSFGREGQSQDGDFTPPKLGGAAAKQARRIVAKERVGDELIMYAAIQPLINKYTQQESQHNGAITLYLFLLDRSF